MSGTSSFPTSLESSRPTTVAPLTRSMLWTPVGAYLATLGVDGFPRPSRVDGFRQAIASLESK